LLHPILSKIHGRRHDVNPQHHACPTASGGIIYGAMLVSCKVADGDGMARPLSFFQRFASQRNSERAGEHFRIEGQDLGLEHH
jgi:hypothetical protein